MAENRIARESENRATTERPKQWVKPDVLPEPTKMPGYAFRWVRVSALGRGDPKNVSSKMREGWEPVRIEEQPQFKFMVDQSSQFKDNIEIQGLLLCKMPVEFVEQRANYYNGKTQANMRAVDEDFMRDNDPRMRKFTESNSKTTFGAGK